MRERSRKKTASYTYRVPLFVLVLLLAFDHGHEKERACFMPASLSKSHEEIFPEDSTTSLLDIDMEILCPLLILLSFFLPGVQTWKGSALRPTGGYAPTTCPIDYGWFYSERISPLLVCPDTAQQELPADQPQQDGRVCWRLDPTDIGWMSRSLQIPLRPLVITNQFEVIFSVQEIENSQKQLKRCLILFLRGVIASTGFIE